ncbi:type II toxin-antitoxin system VapC family toxin [Nonomuraea typhae]|uniref:type II toxin-antitoxin system VapC family toxin n=1 Tax=Nonomuraea typhae TaxID=2603600 RepID=UPI001FEC161F|nr:type II toxin-antitoxin system VapC family toxin [Nonomuraea typhae]
MLDVNVLLYAHREDAVHHPESIALVHSLVNGDTAYAVCDFVINGFLRNATDRRLPRPTPIPIALAFASQVRNQAHAVKVGGGERHWTIFSNLCQETPARGKLVADAYLAALAIEHGCEFVTYDKDFAKFKGLHWTSLLN